MAGINKMPFAVFTIYNTVSAIVWAATFILVGKYIGIEWSLYHQVLHQYMVPSILVALLLVGGYFGIKLRDKRQHKGKKGGKPCRFELRICGQIASFFLGVYFVAG